MSITSRDCSSPICLTISDLPIPGAPHIITGLFSSIQCSSAVIACLGPICLVVSIVLSLIVCNTPYVYYYNAKHQSVNQQKVAIIGSFLSLHPIVEASLLVFLQTKPSIFFFAECNKVLDRRDLD